MEESIKVTTKPYLSDEGAEQLLLAVRNTEYFEKSEAPADLRWVTPSEHLGFEGERIHRIDDTTVVRSIYWHDHNGDPSAFHDTGAVLIYDSYCSREWHSSDLDMFIPGYVAIECAVQYVAEQHALIERTSKAAYRVGHRAGHRSMQESMRNLIGAASLAQVEAA
ncbi:hypothetical protein [Aureimonas sp. SK2]|uniref:hypothetical protein n=1 Tax=Aureimonas sp. SK2 TaxID=3015992 RepID=UPI00244516E4|nr:hypothetical protein [Aureimonas sp. SK2]